MAFSRERILMSFFWKLFERLIVQVVQFIITIVLARLLLPEEYGTIALIAIFIQLCDVIIDGGLNTALVQKKDADNIDFSTIFFFSLGLSGFTFRYSRTNFWVVNSSRNKDSSKINQS